MQDAQFVFSRVQHHVHKKTKKGYRASESLHAQVKENIQEQRTLQGGISKDGSVCATYGACLSRRREKIEIVNLWTT